MAATTQLDWNFREVFGDVAPVDEVEEADMISSLRFNQDGSYLAAGDRGGRVIIFERHESSSSGKSAIEYEFYAEFQAHVEGFDALRSIQVSERVVELQWLPSINGALFLLTANERAVKIWKVENKRVQRVQSLNAERFGPNKVKLESVAELQMPLVEHIEDFEPVCTQKRLFDNVSAYHINAISVSHEQDKFLISDDLKIGVWSLHDTSEAVTIVDLKPPRLDDVQEVITFADYSPTNSALLIYGTSHGAVSLVDTRIEAVADRSCKEFANPMVSSSDLPYNVFGEAAQQNDIAAGISGVHIAKVGNLVAARDLLSVRLWDMRMESRPLQVIPLHPYVKDFAQKLLDIEAVFDRNDVVFNNDCTNFVTGSYTDRFCIYNIKNPSSVSGYNIEATRQVRRRSRAVSQHLGQKSSPCASVGGLPIYEQGKIVYENLAFDTTDIRRKIQFLDWSPTENVIAVATVSNLFVYAAE